jgi:hypothetical protein
MLCANALQFSISFARAYNAPHIEESLAVLRNTHDALGCSCNRVKCDGRLRLLAFPEIADTTGGRIAQNTNFSIAILLTESLNQFA